MVGGRHRAVLDFPRTSNPQGKGGVLNYIPTWRRKFSDGNKKWKWNPFVKSVFADGYHFAAGLKKRGFKVIGSGAFSIVLGKDGYDRVLKVSHKPDGWIDYVKWANGQAFAPKVFSFKRIKGKKADFTVAVVERLEYTLGEAPKDHATKLLPGLLHFAQQGNAMAQKFTDIIAPGLFPFMQGLIEKFGEDSIDFHNGNMMLRKNGDFVVIDPIAGGDTGKYIRLRAGDFTPAVALRSLREFIESSYRHRGEWAC